MRVKRLCWPALFSVLVLVAAGAFAACGGDDDSADDVTGSPTAAQNGDGGDVGNVLNLVSKNTLFDKRELRAKAGATTIEHDHEDAGIVHNVHVYKGVDADGEDIGMTELEAGPVTQTLELTLDAGEYFYVCDSHPATMNGRLIVEE